MDPKQNFWTLLRILTTANLTMIATRFSSYVKLEAYKKEGELLSPKSFSGMTLLEFTDHLLIKSSSYLSQHLIGLVG